MPKEGNMNDKPDAVMKAVAMLKGCETVPDHEQRARRIQEAFRLLDAYLIETPASEHREYIENCKRSHIRAHLKHLSSLDEPDQMTWFYNFALFVTSKEAVEQVLAQSPGLRPWYEIFVESHLEEAAERLTRGPRSAIERGPAVGNLTSRGKTDGDG
jgi:hypothetical protein